MVRGAEVEGSTSTTTIPSLMYSVKAVTTSTTTILSLMHSVKAITILRLMQGIHKGNLMVLGLSVRYVAKLDIKPWIAITEWILHTKGDIHLPNLQPWHPLQMPLKLVKHGLLTLVQQTI